MKSLCVRDIMTSKVITIPRSASASDAARILSSHRISGAPVVDQGRIIGVATKTDLVYASISSSANDKVSVEEVMTPLVFAVRPSDPAMVAVRLMAAEGVHRVVVVDDNHRLAGLVSSMDVLRALAHGGRFLEEDVAALDHVEHAEPAVAVQYVDLREVQIQA